jgi:hypothetical protein
MAVHMIYQFGNVPPREEGGFHYPQKLTNGGFHVLYASEKSELDKAVTRFRTDNGYELGDVSRDTNDYLCSKFPAHCRPDIATESDESPKDKNLRQRVTNWAHNRYAQSQENPDLATSEVAAERLKACEACPYKEEWAVGCPPCVAENERILFIVSKGGNIKFPNAGGCGLCGHDNATAAFLPEALLKHRKNYDLPSICWMKDLKEE